MELAKNWSNTSLDDANGYLIMQLAGNTSPVLITLYGGNATVALLALYLTVELASCKYQGIATIHPLHC